MYSKNKKIKYSIRKTALATVSLAVGLVMVPVVSAEKIVYAEEDVAEATPAEAVEEIEENTGEKIDDAWLPAGVGEPDLAVDSIAMKTTPVKPVLTEVEDATSITQDEKDRVVIEIGKANPDLPEGTSVTVGIDGEVTFTYADGSINTISGEYTVVKRTIARHTKPINPVLTEVEDATSIIQDEKDRVAIEIGKANPELPKGTSVTVGIDGEVTFTYADGSINTISGEYTVVKRTIARHTKPINPVLTIVKDTANITQDEKDRVAIEIGKANPNLPEGTSVTVGIDGEVTFTYADGSTNKIPGKYTVGLKGQTQPVQLEQPKAKEEAKRLPNTGVVTNNAVVAGLSILAVAALLAARRKNNK